MELTTRDQNFSLKWKSDLFDVLKRIKVDYVLKEPEPADPVDSASEEDAHHKEKWRADDFSCRHLILGKLMEDNIFLSFSDYPTAKSLMDVIEAFFGSASAAKKLVRLKRNMNYRKPHETPTFNHLHDMDRLHLKLIYSGMDIPSEMQSALLLDSFPDPWSLTLTSLEMNLSKDKENGWNILNVWKRVKEVGAHMEYLEEAHNDGSRFHDNAGGYGNNKRVRRGNCYFCGRSGHYQSDCPDRR